MEKPFDLKELEKKLKEKGLPEVEGVAKGVVEAVFDWAEESVKASPSKLDDLALVVIPPLKSLILTQVDKIDGKASA